MIRKGQWAGPESQVMAAAELFYSLTYRTSAVPPASGRQSSALATQPLRTASAPTTGAHSSFKRHNGSVFGSNEPQ